jgi:hypothetical protein
MKKRYYNTPVYFEQSFEKVDVDNGIIKGVIVCSEGEAKGHGVFLDKKFIREVVKNGKEYDQGLKARFGHPAMCSTALGTYIGRFKNFRGSAEDTESGKRQHAIADLHLDESAKISPKGNLYDYVLSMAMNNPDMFGSSIVFKGNGVDTRREKNEDGEEITKDYAIMGSLFAADLVDEPAATDSLFDINMDDDFAAQAAMFLDANPEIYNIALKNPEIVDEFMNKYQEFKSKKLPKIEKMENTLKKAWDSVFGKKDKEINDENAVEIMNSLKEEHEASMQEKSEEIEALNNKVEEVETAKGEISAKVEEFENAISAKDVEISELQAKYEELEKEANTLKAEKSQVINEGDPSLESGKVELTPGQIAAKQAISGLEDYLPKK